MANGSFRSGVIDSDIDVPCPNCEYPIWVRLVEVVAHCVVVCPVCRWQIRLNDAEGSVENVADDIENAMEDLMRTIKGMF